MSGKILFIANFTDTVRQYEERRFRRPELLDLLPAVSDEIELRLHQNQMSYVS